jgi:hypothetical protein
VCTRCLPDPSALRGTSVPIDLLTVVWGSQDALTCQSLPPKLNVMPLVAGGDASAAPRTGPGGGGVDPVATFKTQLLALREALVKAVEETAAIAQERDKVRKLALLTRPIDAAGPWCVCLWGMQCSAVPLSIPTWRVCMYELRRVAYRMQRCADDARTAARSPCVGRPARPHATFANQAAFLSCASMTRIIVNERHRMAAVLSWAGEPTLCACASRQSNVYRGWSISVST